MGVEYEHWLFVADTEWRPTWTHVVEISAVLQTWGCKLVDAPYYSIDTGNHPIDKAAAQLMPPNLLVAYTEIQGTRVTQLAGPSDVPDRDRNVYVMLYLGVDYKVLAHIEGRELRVTTPPTTNGKAVVPHEYHQAFPFEVIVYPATWSTTRPSTTGPQQFDGVFRSALALDFGKDTPEIVDRDQAIPNRDFVHALEKAFDTKLVERGWYT